MAAARTLRSDHGAPRAIAPRPWWCGTGRCRTPGGSCDRRTWPPAPLGTPETLSQTWYRPACRSTCRSCSPRRRRRPSSRSAQERAPQAVGPREPTFASVPDVCGPPFHPERSARTRRHRGSLFFEGSQLHCGPLERCFVALSFHRVLGALERKSLLLHDPPQLILAEGDAGTFEQVRVQASQRPDTETVSQLLRWRFDGDTQGGSIRWGRPRRASWRLSRNQALRTTLAVMLAREVHRSYAAAEVGSDRRLRTSRRTHKNDRRVAKDHGVGCGEAQSVEGVPLLVGQAPSCHDRLLAKKVRQRETCSLSANSLLLKIFCGTT